MLPFLLLYYDIEEIYGGQVGPVIEPIGTSVEAKRPSLASIQLQHRASCWMWPPPCVNNRIQTSFREHGGKLATLRLRAGCQACDFDVRPRQSLHGE